MVAPAISESHSEEEDYVPLTDQEFLEWMADRQEDMNAAIPCQEIQQKRRACQE